MTSLQRQRQLQSSYIIPDQTRHIELVVGQILEIEFENSCLFCVLRKSRNPELSGDTKSTNSFEPNSVLSNFGMSQVAPIQVFPRGNSILRNFRILSSADFLTYTKELKISRVSGFPDVLRLKTCTKDLVIPGRSWDSSLPIGGQAI